MPSATYDLLIRGRAAAKAGEAQEARSYLERLLRLDPPQDERMEALYWLSEVCEDPKEQRGYLEEILANNLGDARARRKLAILDGKIKPDEIVDPDRIPAPAPGSPQAAEVRSFTCPKCGGRMVYAPDGQTLTCEYCEARESIHAEQTAPAKDPEEDFLVAMVTAKAQHKPITAQAVTCTGCGASFLLPPETLTQTCPYCNTPYAIEQVEMRQLDAPDGVIPFALNGEEAQQCLHAWLEKNNPGGHLRVSHGVGIYLPVWLFNMGGQVDWSGWVVKNKRYHPVSGTRVVGRYDIMVPASQHLAERLLSAIYGFDLDGMQPYDSRYLAGALAETFQISAAEASLKARQTAMQDEKRDILASEVSGAVEGFSMRTSNMLVESYRLALLPFWKMYFMAGERRYDLVVNGQNGKITGERPSRGLLGWVKEFLEET
jgi:DNA-directed RNA polymerase subunit M/transcription elongation factor TFIIS